MLIDFQTAQNKSDKSCSTWNKLELMPPEQQPSKLTEYDGLENIYTLKCEV